MKKAESQFTNGQLEVLSVLSSNLTDEQLKDLKRQLKKWLFKNTVNLFDEAGDKQGLTEKDEERLLNTRFRRTKKKLAK